MAADFMTAGGQAKAANGVRATLTIESGSLKRVSFALVPGEWLSVGRTDRARWVVADDMALSRVHFEVGFEGVQCRLRDLKSSNGTYLNGVGVEESLLRDGDEIFAGKTRFSFHIESVRDAADLDLATSAVSSGVADSPRVEEAWQRRLLAVLKRNAQPLYVVLDGARDAMVLRTLIDSGAEYSSLLEGQEVTALAPFVPYVAAIDSSSGLLLELLKKGWGKSWGICLSSRAEPWQVVAALRRLLAARLPGGRSAMLRFFDPRVLRALLPTCTPGQLRLIFGAGSLFTYFMLEGDEPGIAVAYAGNSRGLMMCRLQLEGEQEDSSAMVQLEPVEEVDPLRDLKGATADGLVLREDQMKILEMAQQESMEKALLEELQQVAPYQCVELGEEKMREFVRYGSARPRRYGLRSQAEVVSYLRLMLTLGKNFDEDPILPWARDFLTRRTSPSKKLERLWAEAEKWSKGKG